MLKHRTVSLQLVSKLEVQDEKYKKAHITKGESRSSEIETHSVRASLKLQHRSPEQRRFSTCSMSLASGEVLLGVEEERQNAVALL